MEDNITMAVKKILSLSLLALVIRIHLRIGLNLIYQALLETMDLLWLRYQVIQL